MSKTIVDDTLYEKVLSFLTLVLSTHSVHTIIELNKSCQIFRQIKEACLAVDEQDYRVTTLCLRFLGQLIRYGKDSLFQELKSGHPDLLAMVTTGIKSNEATLRCACIEVCRLFLWCDEGRGWLLHNKKATSMIPFALLDQSSYVVAEACQLFAALLTLKSEELLQLMDPSELIRSILIQSSLGTGDQKQILSAMDFCWAILHTFIPSLLSSDRMIRARILEIVSQLFTYDPDPLVTLNLSSDDSSVEQAYLSISGLALDMLEKSASSSDAATVVSLLEASFTLLQRRENAKVCCADAAFSALHQLLHVCMDKGGEKLPNVRISLKSVRSKNSLLQLVIRSVNRLLEADTAILDPGFIDFFDVLKHDVMYSDSRVLKASLELLTSAMYKDQQPAILTQCTHALVQIMMKEDAAMDCKSLSIVLASFDSLLGHEDIGALGKGLAEALGYKLLDTEWDIRDAAVNFVGQLFADDPVKTAKVEFALTYHLPLQVFSRIHDAEPYVRASAVLVLQLMLKCSQGWDYIQQHKISRDLAAKLPCLLYDTEAFVRRAALDTINCLVENRSCQSMLMEIEDSKNQNSLK
ncbi:armadillo-type protein [Parasitella parasitica]|nr:armadillo-type protein [Parasitella parasitica]